MTAFLYFYYYYNRSCLTNLRVSRTSDLIILGPRQNRCLKRLFVQIVLSSMSSEVANEPSLLHVENV